MCLSTEPSFRSTPICRDFSDESGDLTSPYLAYRASSSLTVAALKAARAVASFLNEANHRAPLASASISAIHLL